MTERVAGDWTIEEYGDDECPSLVIHKDTKYRVCFMATPGSKGDPEKIEADAKLIIAAPDFYEAAALMIAAEDSGGDLWWRGFEKLKAAFNKAGGERP